MRFRPSMLLFAICLLPVCAGIPGCGFQVPRGVVWVNPTVTLNDAMQGLDTLLGEHATLKVRYGGSTSTDRPHDRQELYYERWSGDKLVRSESMGSFGVPPEGFTRRMIVHLKRLPTRSGEPARELLTISSSEARRFTLSASTIIDDFPRLNGISEVTAAGVTEQTEFDEDDDIPLAAFARGTSSGKVTPPFAAGEEVLLVKMRLETGGESVTE